MPVVGHSRFQLLRVALLLLALGCAALRLDALEHQALFKGHAVHPTHLLVRTPDPQEPSFQILLRKLDLQIVHRYDFIPGLVLLDTTEPTPPLNPVHALATRLHALQQSALVLYAEPDFVVHATDLPDDARFIDGTLWGLRNTGQLGGVPGADLGAEHAWTLTTGSTDVIVAVLDTGVRFTHQDLAAQMWVNPGEIPGNGIDDDGDGYVDDVHGINAITGNGNPMDDNDHGTHVAGTIGAAANDGHPHVGVCWKVRLLACKFMDATGTGNTSDAIKCVQYALLKHARVLNNSWGGDAFSQSLEDAIAAARAQGALFVAAAGNDASDLDLAPSYPASYRFDNVIAVAALDRSDKLASFSNFGALSVHLGAPGVEIFSTAAGSDTDYKTFQGTSMAAPHVSGVAALVLSRFPEIGVGELRQRLLGTTAAVDALRGRSLTGGRTQAYQALSATPDGVMELNVSTAAGGFVVAGETNKLQARLTDLLLITNASVSGKVDGVVPLTFRDDGQSPDDTAGDAVYQAAYVVPAGATEFSLEVIAQAPGKIPATNTLFCPVRTRPPNDSFAAADWLIGFPANARATNALASKELGEPDHSGTRGGRSLWWNWTCPTNGIVTLQTVGSSFDTVMAVYTGNSVSSLSLIAEDDDSGSGLSSRVTFDGSAGITYRIAVDGYAATAGTVVLQLDWAAGTMRPDNDDLRQALELTGTAANATGSNVGASLEHGEPTHVGIPGGRSVWWTWTAPQAGWVTVKTDGSDFDTLLAVYTGTAVEALTWVAADDDGGEGTRSLVTFFASVGTRYALAVDGFRGAAGRVALDLSLADATAAPSNDAWQAASLLVGSSVTVHGYNQAATKELSEPDHAGNSGGRSVWWSWTPSASGWVTLETAGSTFNTLLSVYSGSAISNLVSIAANDDAALGVTSSRVTLNASANTTYWIAVDGNNDGTGAASGNITLTLSQANSGAPPNDLFTLAAILQGSNAAATASNQGASTEPGEPRHAGAEGGHSIWWRWTAPQDGWITAHTRGSSIDTLLAVYTGQTVGALQAVAWDDDSGGQRASLLTCSVLAGTSYFIAVDGYHGAQGTVQLDLAFQTLADMPPRIDAQPQAASVTAGSPVSFTVLAVGAAPLSYQWRRNGVDLPGANLPTLSWNAAQAGDAGDYTVVVTNALGAATSQSATLVVLPPITLEEALDTTGWDWTSFGNLPWFAAAETGHDGTDAAVSGRINHNQASMVQATLQGPGTLSFWWKVSSEADYDFLRFQMDGNPVAEISGLTDWLPYSGWVEAGLHQVTWVYAKDVSESAGTDQGWLDQVQFHSAPTSGPPILGLAPLGGLVMLGQPITMRVSCAGSTPMQYQWSRDLQEIPGATAPSYLVTNATAADAGSYAVTVRNAAGAFTTDAVTWRVFSYGDLLDAPELPWSTAGDTGWGPTVTRTSDGVDAAESGRIRHSQSTELRTTVLGPGTLYFRWSVSSEVHYDVLRFTQDGATLASLSGEIPWTNATHEVAAGLHVLSWNYSKDGTTSAGLDRAWLDQVHFEPVRVQLTWSKSADGAGQLMLTGPAGGTVRVERSTDLSAWQEWRTVVNFPGRETIVESTLDSVMKFYRAVRLP